MNWPVVIYLSAGVVALFVCGRLDYKAQCRHYNRQINRLRELEK